MGVVQESLVLGAARGISGSQLGDDIGGHEPAHEGRGQGGDHTKGIDHQGGGGQFGPVQVPGKADEPQEHEGLSRQGDPMHEVVDGGEARA